LNVREVVYKETAIEREALTAFRDLRAEGRPVLVELWQIYRVQLNPRAAGRVDRFAFIEAFSSTDACARVAAASVGLDRCTLRDARTHVSAAKSYADCLRDGLSPDMELRVFELAWSNGNVTGWVREPIFWLTTPSTLTRKWLEIPASFFQ